MRNTIGKIFLSLSIIVGLVFVIWGKTLNQGLWGDGYYFLNPNLRNTASGLNIWTYNSMARFIWDIIIPRFRDTQYLYLLLQLIIFSILVSLIYLMILALTENKTVSLVASIVFLSNYGAVYEMLAEGNVNRFLDRVPNLLIVIISLYFLIRYIKKRNIESLIISFILYTIGIFFGHFASFVLPSFQTLPVFFLFNRKKKASSLLKGIAIALCFTVIDYLIISHSDQRSSFPLSYYLNPNSRYLEKIFYIFIPLILPNDFVIWLGKIWPGGGILRPYLAVDAVTTVVLLVMSMFIGKYLYKKNRKFFNIFVPCILSIIAGNALMIYTDPIKYDPFKYFDPGRHLFIQSLFYSIILSIILVVFLSRFKKSFYFLIALFVGIFMIYNTFISWKHIDSTQYLYDGNRKYLSYIKSIYPKFNKDTVVVVGPRLMQMSAFIDDFYTPPSVTFVSAPEDIKKILNRNKKNVYVIDIDYNPDEKGNYSSDRVKIIDLSSFYQSEKLSLSQWGTEHIKDYETFYKIK